MQYNRRGGIFYRADLFDKTILSYEKTIANMKVENENLALEYDRVIEEMEKLGVKEGDLVRLAEMEFEFVL